MNLPNVGDRLMHFITSDCCYKDDTPKSCVVVFVNSPHHYYTVQFVESHIKESYKLPLSDEC